MPVDPTKRRLILVVHGVQTGTDEDMNQHELIRDLVIDRLRGVPLDFDTQIYRYENINDEAQAGLREVLALFLQNMIARKTLDVAIDLVGDVVIALRGGSTANTIRQGLIQKIEEIYNEGNPLYVVAHSLGTIYAFDAVNQLIRNSNYFDRNSRRTWPIQALVTMGSPIGLRMFRRNRVRQIGEGRHFFRWINYWDRLDPVVSGSFYGRRQDSYSIAERFDLSTPDSGWFIQDRVVDVGRVWLKAHVGYWRHPALGDDLASLITS